MFIVVKMPYGKPYEYIGPFHKRESAADYIEVKFPNTDYEYDIGMYVDGDLAFEIVPIQQARPQQRRRKK